MPIIPGVVRVTGIVGPTDSTDTYAVIDPIYGIDGLRSVADLTARDAITTDRRRSGMVVFVQLNGRYYKLNSDLTTWTDFGTTLGGSGLAPYTATITAGNNNDTTLGPTASYLYSKIVIHAHTTAKWYSSELMVSKDQTEISIGFSRVEYAIQGDILIDVSLVVVGPDLILRITNNEALSMDIQVTTIISG